MLRHWRAGSGALSRATTAVAVIPLDIGLAFELLLTRTFVL